MTDIRNRSKSYNIPVNEDDDSTAEREKVYAL